MNLNAAACYCLVPPLPPPLGFVCVCGGVYPEGVGWRRRRRRRGRRRRRRKREIF